MSQWTCNDGMSDDELSPTTVVINSPCSSPEPNLSVPVGEGGKTNVNNISKLNQSNDNNDNNEFTGEHIMPRIPRRVRTPTPDPIIAHCTLSPSPTPSPIKSDHFYTDGCGDRPYVQNARERATSESPPPVAVSEPVIYSDYDDSKYPKRNYQYYKKPRIIVDYTSDIISTKESGTKHDYLSSSDVFSHISLGGRLPHDLMRTVDSTICDKILESFNGTEDERGEFTTFYSRNEGVNSRYNINCVASPHDGLMFLTRNYDIVLGECTKAFLKYNDQVIY